MYKALFWFVVGSVVTLAFAGVMLFIFGQDTHVACTLQEPGQASCSVSNVLLGLVPLPGWKLDGVVLAKVEEDCNDGCTYRTDLVTRNGQGRPISEVWTDDLALNNRTADQINSFLQAGDAPSLVVVDKAAAWVIWLIGGLGVMSIVIQGITFLTQIIRTLFARR